MSTIAEILDEMADTISNVISQTTDIDVQIRSRMVLNPSPPCIDMWPADPSDDPDVAAFGDLVGGELFTVRARVSTADTEEGQDLLLAFMDDEDPLSILAALADDPTLNGTAASVMVRGRSGYTLFPSPQSDGAHLGCLFRVEVLKAHS